MELSPGQQRALFAAVVILLAGLGIYLVGPARHHGPSAAPGPSTSTSPAAAAASAPPSAVQPTSLPSSAASAAGGVNIYDWLPFTQQDLAQASQATLAFAADYGTYSYTETPIVYAGKMSNLVTAEFAATLKADYAAAGVAAQRSAQKQVSSSSGGIAAIRSFGSGSITFVVNIAQKLTITKATTTTTTTTTQYVVTLVSAAGGWQVNDIEFANAGNS